MTRAASSPSDHPIRVLLCEDDAAVRELLARGLELEGFEVELAHDGVEAVVAFDEHRHDAVVADLMMPRGSGMSVLRAVRRLSNVPVIIISAFHDSAHKVIALEEGADDFVGKPLLPRELALRLQNLVEHRGPVDADGDGVITCGPLEIDAAQHQARVNGTPLELTTKELELLTVLAQAPRRVFTRAELLGMVWESNPDWQSVDTVTEHVYRLRQKLAGDPEGARLIQTVRGAGYRMSA